MTSRSELAVKLASRNSSDNSSVNFEYELYRLDSNEKPMDSNLQDINARLKWMILPKDNNGSCLQTNNNESQNNDDSKESQLEFDEDNEDDDDENKNHNINKKAR